MASKCHIGTSGWSYKEWEEGFYPKALESSDWLSYYSQTFNTVELNNSFYRLPTKSMVMKWHEMTPKAFTFSCKAGRNITHIKRLKDCQTDLILLLQTLEGFHAKLGPVLFQLPPRYPLNVELLRHFISILPAHYHYAFEFRDQRWFCQEVYDLLQQANMALCFYDYKASQAPEVITSDFIYIRLHGPHRQPYQGNYGQEQLKTLANKILNWKAQTKAIYCYFDNTEAGAAINDACLMKRYLTNLT